MGSQCRRYSMSRYLDDLGLECQEKDEKCDIYKYLRVFIYYYS